MLWTLLSGINVDWIGLDYFYCPSPDFSTSIVSQSVTNNRCAPSCGGCTREKWGGTSKNFRPALRAGIVPPTSKLLPTPLRNIVLWSVPPSFCAALFINNELFTLADLTADKQAWRGPASFYWAICWPTQKNVSQSANMNRLTKSCSADLLLQHVGWQKFSSSWRVGQKGLHRSHLSANKLDSVNTAQ